jgi:Ras-related protein Rab-8A
LEEVEYKVALLGDGGVGKTSLVKRYVYNKFDEKYHKTLGTTVSKKELIINKDGEKFRTKLIIWDIMGQNIFPQVIKGYLNNTSGVIFVCDLTVKSSFINLLEWIRLVFENTGDVTFVFLANKSDLGQEAFDHDEFELLANIYGSPNFRTSALTGENVERSFLLLAEQILTGKFITNRILPQEGEPVEIPDKILAEDEIIAQFCDVAGGFQVSMPVIREQFTKAGVNFENPTREGLERVVENLVRYMSFLSGETAAKDLERKLGKVLREREF